MFWDNPRLYFTYVPTPLSATRYVCVLSFIAFFISCRFICICIVEVTSAEGRSFRDV